MLLKIKAKIYQYTEIYLAYKEQCDYMESQEFSEKLDEMNDENDFINTKGKIGLLLGLWQVDNGFTRPYNRFMMTGYGKWYKPVLDMCYWISVFFTRFKEDVQWFYETYMKDDSL